MNDNYLIKYTITANERNSIKINSENNKSQLVRSDAKDILLVFRLRKANKRDRQLLASPPVQ